MRLPVTPPLEPMLSRLARELPAGGHVYEPKWDGFRCLAFRDGDDVDLRSRNGRPLGRYFPEIAAALRELREHRVALDGELVVPSELGLDFEALMARLHPAASRVQLLARRTPAAFVAFDVLALGEEDLRERPFVDRRARLERVLADAFAPLHLTPATDDREVARAWLERFTGAGIDGVMAKRTDLTYRPGERAMTKVKLERTADCVVAGFRFLSDRPLPSALLLGMHDERGELAHVGVAASFSEVRRRELLAEIAPHAVPLQGHPWQHGFLTGGSPMGRLKGAAGRWTPGEMDQDWVPLAPVLVCEVAYEQLDRDRFRHPARFRRWRPDRDPSSCTLDQLAVPPPGLGDLLTPARPDRRSVRRPARPAG